MIIILFLVAVFVLYIIFALIFDTAIGFGFDTAYKRILEDLRHDGWNEYQINALIDEIDEGELRFVESGYERLSHGRELLDSYDIWVDKERKEIRKELFGRAREREKQDVTGS